MKNIWKTAFTLLLFIPAIAVQAQYRRYPYPSRPPYQRNQVGRNGEINQDRTIMRRSGPTRLWLDLNYGLSQPLGSLKDYTDKTSTNGWRASLLYQINPKIAVGLGSGFYDYYERIPRKIYQDKNTTISAVQTHTLQLIPIQPTILYFLGDQKKNVKPYIGLGIGVTDVNYKNYWGEFVDKENSISFSASPMIGLRIPFSPTSPLSFNADLRYNFVSYNRNGIKTIQAPEANVGLSINLK